jgi:hypothetical protein
MSKVFKSLPGSERPCEDCNEIPSPCLARIEPIVASEPKRISVAAPNEVRQQAAVIVTMKCSMAEKAYIRYRRVANSAFLLAVKVAKAGRKVRKCLGIDALIKAIKSDKPDVWRPQTPSVRLRNALGQ